MTDIKFVLFFTFFVGFVIYITGPSGHSILVSEGLTMITPAESLNPISSFFTFFTMMLVSSPAQGPAVTVFTLVFVPYLIVMGYLGLKWLRGTG